jgi:hypothetical protein
VRGSATRWPFDLSRAHLTSSERLPQDRATSDARRHLSAAQNIFSQLGAAPWAGRVGSELRAIGQPAARDQRRDPVMLTPQQREIAKLATAATAFGPLATLRVTMELSAYMAEANVRTWT